MEEVLESSEEATCVPQRVIWTSSSFWIPQCSEHAMESSILSRHVGPHCGHDERGGSRRYVCVGHFFARVDAQEVRWSDL
eukprot:11994379-Karenia_brevis.AAC.1